MWTTLLRRGGTAAVSIVVRRDGFTGPVAVHGMGFRRALLPARRSSRKCLDSHDHPASGGGTAAPMGWSHHGHRVASHRPENCAMSGGRGRSASALTMSKRRRCSSSRSRLSDPFAVGVSNAGGESDFRHADTAIRSKLRQGVRSRDFV